VVIVTDCICTIDGEDPHCPLHGYEAVIRRLNSALEEIHDFAANEVVGEEGTWITGRVEQAFTSPPHPFDEDDREDCDCVASRGYALEGCRYCNGTGVRGAEDIASTTLSTRQEKTDG
jgi:hypothetical protein